MVLRPPTGVPYSNHHRSRPRSKLFQPASTPLTMTFQLKSTAPARQHLMSIQGYLAHKKPTPLGHHRALGIDLL